MQPKFSSAAAFAAKTDMYFANLDADSPDRKSSGTDVPTFSGLLLHLGFSSVVDFEQYERNGKYAQLAQQARLRIIAVYEKKLHSSSATGAVFALKFLGWANNGEPAIANESSQQRLQIEILNQGILPVTSEREVLY
jgi:hypothetical protein